MNLSDRDRKLLWTRAADHCSYRFSGDICNRPLTIGTESGAVVVGQECHIVGEKPGAARFLDEFPDRETYSNAILLCGDHHKLIDDLRTRDHYPVQLLLAMKAEHEKQAASSSNITTLIDSTFSVEAADSDLAVGLDISGPVSLSGVTAKVKATNVREACGARIHGGLTALLSTCKSCGSPMTAATVGGATPTYKCPTCGKVQ